MVDLAGQYHHISKEIDQAIFEVVHSCQFINGPAVKDFIKNLSNYLSVKQVIPCGNGTDALQIAMMALNLKRGDEVIVPAFTYAATAEVIGLLGLHPVMVDVDPITFNLTAGIIEEAITSKTKAIIPVHLFGQSSDMEPIMELAKASQLAVIEDNAQAIGADYSFLNGDTQKAGTIGHVGCTSFYPSKNLGCYGDGGAMFTNDEDLGNRLQMVANHGQNERYYHAVIGVNSRLDAIQAAILNVKLKYLDQYAEARRKAASFYDKHLKPIVGIQIPGRQANSTHVFHQYTILVKDGKRDALKKYLSDKGIPTMIYYPVPLYKQAAYKSFYKNNAPLLVTENLCQEVLSLPMHTELTQSMQTYIVNEINHFLK